MLRFLLAVSFLGVSLSASSSSLQLPIRVIESKFSLDANAEVLYRQAGIDVVKEVSASAQDFDQMYIVRLPQDWNSGEDFQGLGSVMVFKKHRFAVIRANEDEVAELSSKLHQEEGMPCGSILRLNGDAIVPVDNHLVAQPMLDLNQKIASIENTLKNVQAERIKNAIEEMSAIETRYHRAPTGQTVASFLIGKYKAIAGNRTDITFEEYRHSTTTQPSLVVRILGKTRPQEIVVLGSHIDSINWQERRDARAPGSDDNASGTSTNLEVFRNLVESGFTFDRTIEIHGYAAEEVGLVGSLDMAKRYSEEKKNVVTMMQIDMNIYRAPNSPRKFWFIEDYTTESFNKNLGKIIDQYIGLPWEIRSLMGGSSDHESWDRYGYTAAFPFENPDAYNHKIHTRADNTQTANDFEQASAFAKLAIAYLGHYAGVNEKKN